jgi:tetratricopeptide (TPR) repeat protein
MQAAQSWLNFTRKVQNTLWEKSALNLLAALHKKLGRKEEASATYQQALAIKIDKQVSIADSGTYAGLGQIYRDLNQPSIAISYYVKME